MNGEFAQLFRFALLVVGGFLAIGGAVMIFVWMGKDEDKKEGTGASEARSGAREARKRGGLERRLEREPRRSRDARGMMHDGANVMLARYKHH